MIKSVGHLAQSVIKKELYKQLYKEVQHYREQGRITKESLQSSYSKTAFIDLLKIIDEENIDQTKFEALKNIFLNTACYESDEQSQMLGYQYLQVCKKLTSMDILVLKAAYEIYLDSDSKEKNKGIKRWELMISEKIGVPRELVSQSRIRNSGATQLTENAMIFDLENRNHHGLTPLGIELGKFLKNL